MEKRGLNPNSLAKASGAKQPQIHRFLTGVSREPRRSTLEPVAAYFGIPVEALFSEGAALDAATELGLDLSGKLVGAEPVATHRAAQPIGPEVVVEQLGLLLAQVPTQYRGSVAETLAIYAREGGSEYFKPAVIAVLGNHKIAA